MSEQVQTGGVMQFNYSRNKQSELEPERRDAIEAGYAEANERKRKERRNKIIFWIILLLIIFLIITYFLIKN